MSEYAHPEVLVDTQWLADHLHDPNVRIIELDMNPNPCNAGHIPGAIFWNMSTDMLLPNFSMNLDTATWEKLLGNSGITNDTTVIGYGDFPAIGGLLFWLLKLFGHSDVRVLNGDRRKWVAENRPLTTESPTITPTQYHLQPPDPSLRAFIDDVRNFNKSDTVLVDVRTLEEYNGELFMMQPPQGNQRAGHIPGAIHLFYELALNNDGTFKSYNQLQKLYGEHGITKDKQAIVYCAVGGRSAHTWFVLKYLLGYPNVRNYDGSWNEWSQIPE
jgi:thiosulfate/3-mercaptopyruvate sulfurtransferase